MSLASDLLSGGSFTIKAEDVADTTFSGTKRRGAYGDARAAPGGGGLLSAYITPSRQGAPLMDARIYFRGRIYETTQRLDYLKELRDGKLIIQFNPRGGVRNAIVTLKPDVNARFQVWLDSLEESGRALVAYG